MCIHTSATTFLQHAAFFLVFGAQWWGGCAVVRWMCVMQVLTCKKTCWTWWASRHWCHRWKTWIADVSANKEHLSEELFVFPPSVWFCQEVCICCCRQVNDGVYEYVMYVATESCFSLPISINWVHSQAHTHTCCGQLHMTGIVWSAVENVTTNSMLMGPTRYQWSSDLCKVVKV